MLAFWWCGRCFLGNTGMVLMVSRLEVIWLSWVHFSVVPNQHPNLGEGFIKEYPKAYWRPASKVGQKSYLLSKEPSKHSQGIGTLCSPFCLPALSTSSPVPSFLPRLEPCDLNNYLCNSAQGEWGEPGLFVFKPTCNDKIMPIAREIWFPATAVLARRKGKETALCGIIH